MDDHTRSSSTQPYRTTPEAQTIRRQLARLDIDPSQPIVLTTYPDGKQTITAPFRCQTCKTPQATQLEADLCCPANELPMDAASAALTGAFRLLNLIPAESSATPSAGNAERKE